MKERMIYDVSATEPPVRTELEKHEIWFDKEAIRSHQILLKSPDMRLTLVLSTLSILQVEKVRHKEVMIESCEKCETLPFLKANKLVSRMFMDASRRQRTPGAETNDLVTHGSAGGMNFIVLCLSCPME